VSTIALLAFQAASVLATQPDERLLHPAPPSTCHASATEIVVCGKDADSYRLPKSGPAPDAKGPPTAEWGLIGDAKMNAHGTQRGSLGMASAPAAMVTVTIPF
jgi:hypothetical protein